jgi:hypothetical protein
MKRIDVPKFEPCANCADNPGWVTLTDGTVKRCACWYAYIDKQLDDFKRKWKR